MINLIKLSVGVASVEELNARQKVTFSKNGRIFHTTRMVPKRSGEILCGGSIYWVIKGHVQARQLITDIEIFKDPEGIRKCHLVLDQKLHLTKPFPRRAFQGWRYLKTTDSPPDDIYGGQTEAMPAHMRRDLMALGLL